MAGVRRGRYDPAEVDDEDREEKREHKRAKVAAILASEYDHPLLGLDWTPSNSEDESTDTDSVFR